MVIDIIPVIYILKVSSYVHYMRSATFLRGDLKCFFYQSCHLKDNFKHLAEEVGRCYTIGCPSACTISLDQLKRSSLSF